MEVDPVENGPMGPIGTNSSNTAVQSFFDQVSRLQSEQSSLQSEVEAQKAVRQEIKQKLNFSKREQRIIQSAHDQQQSIYWSNRKDCCQLMSEIEERRSCMLHTF